MKNNVSVYKKEGDRITNELWKFDKGYIAGYTQDKQLMSRIKRYKPHWKLVAEYHDTRNVEYEQRTWIFARQYRIPSNERR